MTLVVLKNAVLVAPEQETSLSVKVFQEADVYYSLLHLLASAFVLHRLYLRNTF